jgi:hypothetical protein
MLKQFTSIRFLLFCYLKQFHPPQRGFCKYHNFLGHNTSRCSLFRDLVQKGLNEGRLKFGNKPKPQIQVDSDHLKDACMMYTDIAGYNMVETIIDAIDNLFVKAKGEAETEVAECQLVDVKKDAEYAEETDPKPKFEEKRRRIVMPFVVKNDRMMYQKVKETIMFEQIVWNKITVYLVEIRSRKP